MRYMNQLQGKIIWKRHRLGRGLKMLASDQKQSADISTTNLYQIILTHTHTIGQVTAINW